MADHSAMKLGKQDARYDRRTMKLSKYVPRLLPIAETQIDYSNRVADWGMMLNDKLGCCTCAAACHLVQLATMNDVDKHQGVMETPPDAVVLDLYERWCGYDPNDPYATDNGGVELDVLNRWRREGVAGHKLLSYAAINRTNYRHLQFAINEFNVYIGVELPVSAQDQETWDVVKEDGGDWGGHAINLTGYDDTDPDNKIIQFVSWGKPMGMTLRFWNRYVSEAYALMLEDWEGSKSHGSAGVDLVAWQADLEQITAV